jgi:hypothetical protein
LRAPEAIRQALSHVGPLCDDCLSKETGIHPRQQINQLCRKMAKAKLILRENSSCPKCFGDKYINRVGAKAVSMSSLKGQREQAMERPWYWEGNVQGRIVQHLKARGYKILREADTDSKESGRDIEAQGVDDGKLWLSVKGYPEKSPNTQARHWFAEALFDLILYRSGNSTVVLGIGLPEGYKTYMSLSRKVAWFKRSAPFRFYWVSESGAVREE